MGFNERLLLQASAEEGATQRQQPEEQQQQSQHPDAGRFKEVKTRFTLECTRVRYRGEWVTICF